MSKKKTNDSWQNYAQPELPVVHFLTLFIRTGNAKICYFCIKTFLHELYYMIETSTYSLSIYALLVILRLKWQLRKLEINNENENIKWLHTVYNCTLKIKIICGFVSSGVLNFSKYINEGSFSTCFCHGYSNKRQRKLGRRIRRSIWGNRT